jgi:D-glycero-D-manno-heptose 1,7-bisphosphate phosphatase
MNEDGMERGLFLDRDGVINEEVGFLIRSQDVRFVPGIFSLCRTARTLGYRIFVVTNQSGIARGYYTEEEFWTLMSWMQTEFAREGVGFDAVYHCPFHPEHGVGVYRQEHEDRKPSPGMLRRGEREFGVSLAQSVLVGDRCTDIAAANTAGLQQAFLIGETETKPCDGEFLRVTALDQVERWLLERG